MRPAPPRGCSRGSARTSAVSPSPGDPRRLERLCRPPGWRTQPRLCGRGRSRAGGIPKGTS
eukprot:6863567-Prymnesium_polylepis.1